MSTSSADIFKEALDLNERDRATLAGLLIESLEEGFDDELESVWKAEVARRVTELDSGDVKALAWEDVKARLLLLRTPRENLDTGKSDDC
jgi:putative addiction module component (TIGR02574 family)